MNVPVLDPNAPSQEELVEQQVTAMKAQLAHRLAIEVVGKQSLDLASYNEAERVSEFCIQLSDKLVEAYRPKTPARMVN